MNPRVSLLILITAIFFSCSTDVKEETPALVTTPKTLSSEIDTFYAGNNLLQLTDTTETAFNNFFTASSDTSEANNIKLNSSTVRRTGDTLFITLDNSKTVKYITEPYLEGSDNCTLYKYLGKVKGLNYHLIYVGLYEAFTYLMVNGNSGKETYICGEPSVSPNKKQVAAACFDLQAGFVFNGVQVYSVETDSLKLNWSRELTKWGADNIAWLNDTNLLVEKMYLDTNQNVLKSFVKMSFTGK